MVFRRYCIQTVKDGIQIQVYNSNNESVNHFSHFISVKVKKHLRKSQAQFREKLRKLRLRRNNDYLLKKINVYGPENLDEDLFMHFELHVSMMGTVLFFPFQSIFSYFCSISSTGSLYNLGYA